MSGAKIAMKNVELQGEPIFKRGITYLVFVMIRPSAFARKWAYASAVRGEVIFFPHHQSFGFVCEKIVVIVSADPYNRLYVYLFVQQERCRDSPVQSDGWEILSDQMGAVPEK